VFVHVIAAVFALGTMVHTNFNLNGLQAIVPTIALVASALAQSVYSHSRATAGGGQPSKGEAAPIVIRLTGMEPVHNVGGNGERSVAGS
jgi:hypothetical protein